MKIRAPAVKVLLAAAAATAFMSPTRLSATVEQSPHDLISQGYAVPREGSFQEQCLACHPSLESSDPDFFKKIPPSLRSFSPSSLLCFSCHDGTTLVNPNVDASTTAFHPLSHGYDLEEYRGRIAEAADLPGTDGPAMDCVTCHDPHANGNRPFLRAPLSALCEICHVKMVGAGTGPAWRKGNHPVRVSQQNQAKEGVPLKVDESFRTVFPKAYPARMGKTSAGVHWDLGGHLDGGGEGEVACVTCHAVHGDEKSAPETHLLSLDPVKEGADEFCEGCHRGQRGDQEKSPHAPNPGGTLLGRTYHPCDDDESNGTGRFFEILEPPGWPFGSDASRPLLCTTCHRAHGAQEETELLRPWKGGQGFCGECHETMPLVYHHPAGTNLTGKCSEEQPAEGQTGLQTEQKNFKAIFCSNCHRAHNAGLGTGREEKYLPLLRAALDAEDLCLDCHNEENPTCGSDPEAMASHFLGDPTLPETYDKADPSLRTDPWPESGLESVFGGPLAKSVVCLSCHAFRQGALVSGDAGASGHLLARAGNAVEWEDGNKDSYDLYLCTGCHSPNPSTGGEGSTHPLMKADAAKLGEPPLAPMTTTPGGRVNCDSCHRTHGARTASGYYILEVIKGENIDPKAIHPKIDFTILCGQCHKKYAD